jgi:hypothetical protein
MPTPKQGYFLADRTKVPSVTQILGKFKDPGPLIWWAREQGYEQCRLGLPINHHDRTAIDIGTAAHAMFEAHLAGKERPEEANNLTDPDMREKADRSYKAYLEWRQTFPLTMVAQEIYLVSEKDRYGGTPDAVGLVNNALALLDWKTANGVYTDHVIQLAAYKNLWEENRPEKPITGGCHLLRFGKKSGGFEHRRFPDFVMEIGLRQFKRFRAAFDDDKELKELI